MVDIRAKYVPPAIDQIAFNCPHCGALTQQFWFTAYAEPMRKGEAPRRFTEKGLEELNLDHIQDPVLLRRARDWARKMARGRPFLEPQQEQCDFRLENVSVSRCYNCDDVSLWIYNRLVWPQKGEGPLPNPDLPEDVQDDYMEASRILDLSPRGAAALLRVGIQKLCKHLGEKGRNIDTDIASLVKKGLDKQVQQALDVVRVIGNNAVHPGQIDLHDDRATAENLFGLVNLIAEIMISRPKHVDEMYAKIPQGALDAIARRDKADTE